MVHSTTDIQKEVILFFESFYRARGCTLIVDQIWGSDSYPTMFDEAQNLALYKPVDLDEIHKVLKSFAKDKCPGQTVGLLNSSYISLT